jgi:hypothetical protein
VPGSKLGLRGHALDGSSGAAVDNVGKTEMFKTIRSAAKTQKARWCIVVSCVLAAVGVPQESN